MKIRGWRRERTSPSLEEVYRTIPVAARSPGRRLLAFIGPGYLVAVGYMDPGNWATDLAGGSAYGYTLLFVIHRAQPVVRASAPVGRCADRARGAAHSLPADRGFRKLEAFVIALVALIAGCFLFELILARPDPGAIAGGLLPSVQIVRDPGMLYIAMGIFGATAALVRRDSAGALHVRSV